MEDQTTQKAPQNDRKSTANYTAEGDMQVINNYYPDDAVVVTFDVWDVIGLAVLVCAILALGGMAIWMAYEVGLKIFALWGWISENWKTIAVGFFAVSVVVGATIWGYVTYTKDTNDDLL